MLQYIFSYFALARLCFQDLGANRCFEPNRWNFCIFALDFEIMFDFVLFLPDSIEDLGANRRIEPNKTFLSFALDSEVMSESVLSLPDSVGLIEPNTL